MNKKFLGFICILTIFVVPHISFGQSSNNSPKLKIVAGDNASASISIGPSYLIDIWVNNPPQDGESRTEKDTLVIYFQKDKNITNPPGQTPALVYSNYSNVTRSSIPKNYRFRAGNLTGLLVPSGRQTTPIDSGQYYVIAELISTSPDGKPVQRASTVSEFPVNIIVPSKSLSNLDINLSTQPFNDVGTYLDDRPREWPFNTSKVVSWDISGHKYNIPGQLLACGAFVNITDASLVDNCMILQERVPLVNTYGTSNKINVTLPTEESLRQKLSTNELVWPPQYMWLRLDVKEPNGLRIKSLTFNSLNRPLITSNNEQGRETNLASVITSLQSILNSLSNLQSR